MTMTKPDNGSQDTDMLCDYELLERGEEPRFPESLTDKEIKKHSPTGELNTVPTPTGKPENTCHFCGNKMEAPVSRFMRYGVDFVPENKEAHEGCARKQFEKVKDALKTIEEGGGDEN